MVDAGLYIAYGLILIALLLSLGFPLVYMAKNPKEAKTALIGVAIVAVVFLVAYLIAPSEFYFHGIEKYNLVGSQLKLIGAGLNTFYILGAIAVIAAVYSEVSSAVK